MILHHISWSCNVVHLIEAGSLTDLVRAEALGGVLLGVIVRWVGLSAAEPIDRFSGC